MKTAVAPSMPASLGQPRHLHALVTVIGLGLALALGLRKPPSRNKTR